MTSTAEGEERTREILRYRGGGRQPTPRGRLVRRALLIVDALGLVVSFLVAEFVFGGGGRQGPLNTSTETLLFVATVPGWLVLAKLYGLYDRDQQRTGHPTSDDIVGILHMVTLGTWLFFAVTWLARFAAPDLAKVFAFWGIAVVVLPLGRVAARASCRRRPAYGQKTLIYGAGKVGQDVARKFLRHPEYGVSLVGFVDSSPPETPSPSNGCPMLGPCENLREIVQTFDIDRVVIAAPADSDNRVIEQVRSLAELEVHIDIVPALQEIVGPKVDVHAVEGLPLLGLPSFALTRTQRRLKRTMDVVLSLVGLILLAPVFVLFAILIKLDSRGPVLFRQLRMGAEEKPFHILKLRTMTPDADARKQEFAHLNKHATPGGDDRMFKIADDPRMTRVGRILRRYSLDELPQLINVLKGEMTLVGPRPLILDEDLHIGGWARKRLALKPGMTGLWQVLGRSEIPFEEMIKLDCLYVTNWSLWRDCRLLLRTVPLMLKGVRETY
ncbi:MAG: sugar transferase [Actinobacteria bacterium]|nr:sugar transferase [Actinomycetota bacterium]